jgi:hypothetical protein
MSKKIKEVDVTTDNVNHPKHYTSHPSGIECIEVTQYFNFCLGNAIKYIWRADSKNNDLEDLHKAAWYINQEIARRKADKNQL